MATGVDDLLECALGAERCRAGQLDPAGVPAAPLDVLAQQLVALGTEGDWRDDDAYRLVRRAAPYAELPRADFDAVLDDLSESDESPEERRVPLRFRLLAAGTTDSMLLEERDAFLRRLWEQAVERSAISDQRSAGSALLIADR